MRWIYPENSVLTNLTQQGSLRRPLFYARAEKVLQFLDNLSECGIVII